MGCSGTRRTETVAAGLSATIAESVTHANGRVLYCLPAGGMSRQYFDLDVTWIGTDVALIDVPVFLGFGEHDIAGNVRATSVVKPKCRDITLYELAGSGHSHTVAPHRQQLWDRLANWAAGIA